jgi:tetratricopeptide (TPR) repeat protein
MRRSLLAGMLLSFALLPQQGVADAAAQARIQLFSKDLASNPNQALVLVHRALAYSDNGQPIKAMQDLAEARALGLPDEALYVQGVLAIRAGEQEQAFSHFDSFVKVRPRHRQALEYRARLARDTGRNEQALADYQALLELSPNVGPGHYIATARLIANIPEQGIEAALVLLDARMAETGPLSSLQRYAIELELERNNYDAAIARMGQLPIELRATPEWQVQVAEILILAGREREASPYLDVALQQMQSLRPTAARQRLKGKAQAMANRITSAIQKEN